MWRIVDCKVKNHYPNPLILIQWFFLSLITFQINVSVFQLRLTPLMRSGRRRSWGSGLAEAEKLCKLQDPEVAITTTGKVEQEGKNSSLLSYRIRKFQQQKENQFWSNVPRVTAGFIPPFFMEVVTIVVLFPERSYLELQDPECPGIPWRLWVWKEHPSPWRAPGNNCPLLPGDGASLEQMMVLSARVHKNTPGFVTNLCSVLCLCSSCFSVNPNPATFCLKALYGTSLILVKPAWICRAVLLWPHQSQALLSLVLQLLLPTPSCTESKFPFVWIAEIITDFLG